MNQSIVGKSLNSQLDKIHKTNLEEFKNTLFSLFASLPYNNYIKNQIAKVEGYWASLVYCYLAGAGLEIIAEDVTNRGRIDLTIKIEDNIYILEFKVTNEDPLKQIKEGLDSFFEFLPFDKKIRIKKI